MSAAFPRMEAASLRRLVLIGGVAAGVVLLYSDSFSSMADAWEYSTYRHCFFVFPISAYLLWRVREPLARTPIRPWAWGLVPLVGLVFLWSLSRAVGVQAGEHAAAVLLIPAAVATCFGLALVRRALFPLLFLLAAVPVGDALVPFLMDLTADLSAGLLRLTGVPVYREGQLLTLPGGVFEVADVCSGLRSLIAGTVVALLFAYLSFESVWKRVAIVAAFVLALIVVNGVRAFIVMWVASATNMRVLAGMDHVYFGWVLFFVAIAALLWFFMRFADTADDVDRAARDSSASTAAGGAPRAAYLRTGVVVLAAVGLLVLAGGPVLIQRSSIPTAGRPLTVQLPQVAGCSAPQGWAGGWQPSWPSPDSVAVGSYACSGAHVNVYFAAFRGNAQGRELVSDEGQPMPAAWRLFLEEDMQRFSVGSRTTTVRELRVDGGGQSSVIWFWYVVGGEPVSSPFAVKLLQALEVLKGRSAGGAVYWLETSLEPVLADSRERLTRVASVIADVGALSASQPHEMKP